MNKLSTAQRAQIIGLMVEGMSIRAISRTTGASKNTVVKLLADAGEAFWDYQNRTLRALLCKSVQCDEIWSFVYAKDKNAPEAMKAAGEAGDIWTWTAICADSKLIVSWMVGDRTYDTAEGSPHEPHTPSGWEPQREEIQPMDQQQRKEEVTKLLRDAITPAKGATTTITVHKLVILVTPSASGLEFLTAARQIIQDKQP